MRKITLLLTALTFALVGIVGLAQDNKHPSEVKIDIRDDCDPTSFNAALGNGICTRDTSSGAVTINGR